MRDSEWPRDITERTRLVARYIVDNRATIRQTAAHFGKVSKSAIHYYLKKHLFPACGLFLYLRVREVLNHNKAMGPSRGGKVSRLRRGKLRELGRRKEGDDGE